MVDWSLVGLNQVLRVLHVHVVEALCALHSRRQDVRRLLVDDQLLVVDGAVRVGPRLVLLVAGRGGRKLVLRVF